MNDSLKITLEAKVLTDWLKLLNKGSNPVVFYQENHTDMLKAAIKESITKCREVAIQISDVLR